MPTETDKLLAQRLDQIDEKLDRVIHAVEGNGQPGLKTRVALLEDGAARVSKFLWFIVAAVVGAVVNSFRA